MKNSLILLLTLCGTALFTAEQVTGADVGDATEVRLSPNTKVIFASVSQGQEILVQRDTYVQAMASLERQIRMHSNEVPSEEAFLEHTKQQVIEFSSAQKKKLADVAQSLAKKLSGLQLSLPPEVTIVQTTGQEEGNAAYTRGTAIFLPKQRIESRAGSLERLFAHELFHVISRNNPLLRKRLYAIIGFTPCSPITLPEPLHSSRITNPDAPTRDFVITLEHEGETIFALPVLFCSPARYDARRKRLFDYLQFRLLAVERDGEDWQPIVVDDKPLLISPQANESFKRQIGNNTNYIIHPDEILADNFVHMAMKTKNLPNPEIVEQMQDVFKEKP